jgi:hypothetical protein
MATPQGAEAEPHRCPCRLSDRTVKRVFPWTRSSSCETPVSPTGVSAVSATLAGHCHIGVAAPATETGQRSRASQEPPLLLGIVESRPPRSHIRRSQCGEINFRDSRPSAAGLPILEVDPASEAVEVPLSLVEILLSSVPPDADLWGALKVQKAPVRVALRWKRLFPIDFHFSRSAAITTSRLVASDRGRRDWVVIRGGRRCCRDC